MVICVAVSYLYVVFEGLIWTDFGFHVAYLVL